MLIPALIALACFGAGVVACVRWLPELAPGSVGGLAFFTVCGLLAGALALTGVRVYSLVRELENALHGTGFGSQDDILASGLGSILFECGSLVALAGILYLLAPAPDDDGVDSDLTEESLAG